MSPKRSVFYSYLIKLGWAIALLFGLAIGGMTGYGVFVWSLYLKHPGSFAGNVEGIVAHYTGLATLGLCLLEAGILGLAMRYQWISRSVGRWSLYALGAIAGFNGILLTIPWIAR